MRVRLECDRMDAGVLQNMGDVVDLDPIVARRMIEAGSASVLHDRSIETATRGPAENAARRTPNLKRGR